VTQHLRASRYRVALAVALASAAVFTRCDSHQPLAPTTSPDQIAYSSLYSPDWVIFVVSADSTITGDLDFYENLAEGQLPTWSPDGSRIAFLSSRGGNRENIYVMNADGSGQSRLTNDTVFAAYPYSWSPDGSRLAFAAGQTKGHIFVVATDGSGLTRMTSDSVADGSPAWSPDGTKIAFVRADGSDSRIYVMKADGSAVIRLTNASASDYDPHWSAEGSKLAFTRYWPSDTANSGVHVMNADGMGLHRIGPGHSPRWSPDGTRILFLGIGVWVANSDGSGLHQVADSYDSNPVTSPASWSPDSRRIAFVNLGQVWTVNADGSGLQDLIQNGCCQKRNPVWRPRKP
jgi:Tol biopolymer transport system component